MRHNWKNYVLKVSLKYWKMTVKLEKTNLEKHFLAYQGLNEWR